MCYSATCTYEDHYGNCIVNSITSDYLKYFFNVTPCMVGGFRGEDEQIPEQKMEIIEKELNRIDHIEFGTKEYNDLKSKIDMMRDLRGDRLYEIYTDNTSADNG